MFFLLTILFASSCKYEEKYWCDVFNGYPSCYSHIMCSTYGFPCEVSSFLSSSYSSSLSELLSETECVYSDFTDCDDLVWTNYSDCVESANCQQLLTPSFLSQLPAEVWIAVKPKGLESGFLDEDTLEAYRSFQVCIRSCEGVCIAADEENDIECLENCLLVFCV
jgi:hypothetical protein